MQKRDKTGVIEAEIDLVNTLESGQSFLWRKKTEENEGDNVYSSSLKGEGVRVWDVEGGVAYETTGADESEIRKALGITDPLDEIYSEIKRDPRVSRAIEEYRGLRVVSDPFFPCTVSFIISAQNRIPRIKKLVDEIGKRYGDPIEGYDAYRFPSPEELARVDEEELREIGLGYRAPYVIDSAELIAEGKVDPKKTEKMEYKEAHREVQELVGVGDKVADCILLFSLGFHEAVPIDTWIDKTVEEYYPELSGDNYMETGDNIREKFGKYAGYAQNYLFHYIRHHG